MDWARLEMEKLHREGTTWERVLATKKSEAGEDWCWCCSAFGFWMQGAPGSRQDVGDGRGLMPYGARVAGGQDGNSMRMTWLMSQQLCAQMCIPFNSQSTQLKRLTRCPPRPLTALVMLRMAQAREEAEAARARAQQARIVTACLWLLVLKDARPAWAVAGV